LKQSIHSIKVVIMTRAESIPYQYL
jgi:hypothetical protein